MYSKLLQEAFKEERIMYALKHAKEKKLNPKLIRRFCDPSYIGYIVNLIVTNSYNIAYPTEAEIPKDEPGKFRTVFMNEPVDRIIMSLLADTVSDIFKDMIHPSCRSYQKGMGTQQTVCEISKCIQDMGLVGHEAIGVKTDFSKYFDSVLLVKIEEMFDKWESMLGFEKDTEPVINMFRRYYRQNEYWDKNGNLRSKYQSLKQGCALAAPLANMLLYELDEFMSKKYKVYYRYSDDIMCLGGDANEIVNDINNITAKYGVILNPKKVEPVYADQWIKFLGFNIKQGYRTLSTQRVVKFKNKIKELTVKQKNITMKKATRNVMNYLYGGEHCWADSCLGTINVEEDIKQLNFFVMDCIKACGTNKKRIGGIGSTLDRKDYTIVRHCGRNVSSNKEKEGHIENYESMVCLWKALRQSKSLYKSLLLQVGM